MSVYTIVEESRKIRRDAYAMLKECFQNQNDKEFIKAKISLCEIFLTVVQHMFKNECVNGPQKTSCFYTLNHLLSIKETLFTLANVQGGAVNPFVKWVDLQEIFDGCIKVGMIKNFGFKDVTNFLNASKVDFCKKVLEVHQSVKVYVKLEALFTLTKSDRIIEDNKSFISNTFSIFQFSNISELYESNVTDVIVKSIEEFQESDSGWTLKHINFVTVHIHKHNPLRAGTYLNLPKFIKNKGACINIQNDDNFCFKWSIISALMHQEIAENNLRNGETKKISNPHRVSNYVNKEKQYNVDFSGLNFPVAPSEIKCFEQKNGISVNLYCVEELENGNSRIVVAQPSSISKRKRHVNLLLIQETIENEELVSIDAYVNPDQIITKKRKSTVLRQKYNSHYVYIKNLSALIGSQTSRKEKKKYFCDICFHYFSSLDILNEHEIKCLKNNHCEIVLPNPDDPEQCVLEFCNHHYKLPVPFVVYSDFESVLEPIEGNEKRKSHHEPASVGYYFKCR